MTILLEIISNLEPSLIAFLIPRGIEIKYTSATDSNVYSDWFEKLMCSCMGFYSREIKCRKFTRIEFQKDIFQ